MKLLQLSLELHLLVHNKRNYVNFQTFFFQILEVKALLASCWKGENFSVQHCVRLIPFYWSMLIPSINFDFLIFLIDFLLSILFFFSSDKPISAIVIYRVPTLWIILIRFNDIIAFHFSCVGIKRNSFYLKVYFVRKMSSWDTTTSIPKNLFTFKDSSLEKNNFILNFIFT